MVTDTAFCSLPYYHSPEDTYDKLDYDRLARVVSGIEVVVLGNRWSTVSGYLLELNRRVSPPVDFARGSRSVCSEV